MTVRIVNWNVAWATKRSDRSPELLRRIRQEEPDVICLTEAYADFLDELGGHVITSGADYGYAPVPGRRKVLLWSREPWSEVDELGS